MSLLLKLRDDRAQLPAAAVALSPWTDLALTGPSLKSNAAADPMMNADDLPYSPGSISAAPTLRHHMPRRSTVTRLA